MIALRKVKQGGFIKRTKDAKTIYIKNHYNRDDKTFSCSDTNDMNREGFIKADKLVEVDFTY